MVGPTVRAQARGNGNAKPHFYNTGHILGRVSKLYGGCTPCASPESAPSCCPASRHTTTDQVGR